MCVRGFFDNVMFFFLSTKLSIYNFISSNMDSFLSLFFLFFFTVCVCVCFFHFQFSFLYAWNFTSKKWLPMNRCKIQNVWQNVIQIYWCSMDQMSVSNRISSEQIFAWTNLINAEDNVIHLNAVALTDDNDRNARESKCNNSGCECVCVCYMCESTTELEYFGCCHHRCIQFQAHSSVCLLCEFFFQVSICSVWQADWLVVFPIRYTYVHAYLCMFACIEIEPFAVHISSSASCKKKHNSSEPRIKIKRSTDTQSDEKRPTVKYLKKKGGETVIQRKIYIFSVYMTMKYLVRISHM